MSLFPVPFENEFISTPAVSGEPRLLSQLLFKLQKHTGEEICLCEWIPTMAGDLCLSDALGWFTAWCSISGADLQPLSTMYGVWGHPAALLPSAPRPRDWPPPSGSKTLASPAGMGSADSQPECKDQSMAVIGEIFVFGGTATAKGCIHPYSYLNKVHIEDFTCSKSSVNSWGEKNRRILSSFPGNWKNI